jgi:hypothetical protein
MEPDLDKILGSIEPGWYLFQWAQENGRLPEDYEKLLLEIGSLHNLCFYVEYTRVERWPEAEEKMLKSNNTWILCFYAEHVMKERWAEAEEAIKKDSELWENYCKHFGVKDGE